MYDMKNWDMPGWAFGASYVWRHTLQEVALLAIGFNPGPFQTQIQHIGRFIAKGEGYIDQYFAKASYKFDIAGSPLSASYQFYGTRDH
jgi:hypothetical protein